MYLVHTKSIYLICAFGMLLVLVLVQAKKPVLGSPGCIPTHPQKVMYICSYLLFKASTAFLVPSKCVRQKTLNTLILEMSG